MFYDGESIRPRRWFGKRNLSRSIAQCCLIAVSRTRCAMPMILDLLEFESGSAVGDLPRLRRAGAAGGVGDAGRRAAVVHLGIEAIALLLEARHDRPFERTAARQ